MWLLSEVLVVFVMVGVQVVVDWAGKLWGPPAEESGQEIEPGSELHVRLEWEPRLLPSHALPKALSGAEEGLGATLEEPINQADGRDEPNQKQAMKLLRRCRPRSKFPTIYWPNRWILWTRLMATKTRRQCLCN